MNIGGRSGSPALRQVIFIVATVVAIAAFFKIATAQDASRPRKIRRSDRFDFAPLFPQPFPTPSFVSHRELPSPTLTPLLPSRRLSPSPTPVLSLPFTTLDAYASNLTPVSTPAPESPIICDGDRVRFLDGGKRIIGEGNVRLEYKDMRLRADRVEVDVAGKKARAEGNVEFHQYDRYLLADRLHYDLDSEELWLSPGKGYFPPWYGGAEEIEAVGAEQVKFRRGYFTTCDLEQPHYNFSSRRVEIYPGDRIVARNVTFYIGKIPLFWIPFFWRSLKGDCSGVFIRPGYRNSWGFYLLSGYQWCLPGFRAALNLDWRYRRGMAYGLEGDFLPWDRARGDWMLYYIDDQLVSKEDRYLVEIDYRQSWPGRITANLSLNYSSDADLRREFFRSQYDANKQPRSFLSLSKTWPDVTLSFEAQGRLNEFERVTERLPEVKLQTREIQIGETDFFYEITTALTNFYNRYPDLGPALETALRLDTFQKLGYSRKFWGWLNLLPHLAFRQSYYSRGPGEEDEDEDKNLWRRVFSAGLGVSTAIYGVYPAASETLRVDRLRHVIEPSLDYVFVDHPSLDTDRVFWFDQVERIGPLNYTQVGLRNLLQTKRTIAGREENWTLMDFLVKTDVYTYPDKSNQGRLIDDLAGELRFTPVTGMGLRCDLGYDTYESVVNRSTLGLWLQSEKDWRVSLNHVYRRDRDRSNLDSTVFLRVSPKWAFEAFARYDLVSALFEEKALSVQRDLHCWDSILTVRHREARDEFEVFLALWIKAFPQAGLRLSN